MTYVPAESRYDAMSYRRSGRSGLKLPAISLGLWQNFGGDRPLDVSRAIVRRAFDLGITHFDLANNYGPPYGAAEETFGRLYAGDLAPYRDELIISTKAGWDMWPGPYGDGGSRKYLLASLDQSLGRMGLDYVDIFYSHRRDPETPLEETMGALDTAVEQGKALYAGISSYGAEQHATRQRRSCASCGTPLVLHQPAYNIFNRWIEPRAARRVRARRDRLHRLLSARAGTADRPLPERRAGGLARQPRRVVVGRPARRGDARQDPGAERDRRPRGQTLAQLALAWALRDPRVTSALIGASSVDQLEQNVASLDHLELSAEELAEIDRIAPS